MLGSKMMRLKFSKCPLVGCNLHSRFRNLLHLFTATPLVSVVTVVYNGAAYLERAMLSVWAQDYPEVEYIIIDGGSTDGTLDIIRRHEDKLAAWVSEPDRGISDAFNKGIAKSTGHLVGILNADDWYEPQAISRAVQAFLDGAEVIHGNQQYWLPDGQGGVTKDFTFTADQSKLPLEMTINHPTVFVARDVYQDLGLFRLDMRYAMDYELMLRFWLGHKRFVHIPVIQANMQLDGASDQNWPKAYYESYLAKRINGIGWGSAYPYYLKMMIRTTVARLLPSLGLGAVLIWFRSKFALTAKTK